MFAKLTYSSFVYLILSVVLFCPTATGQTAPASISDFTVLDSVFAASQPVTENTGNAVLESYKEASAKMNWQAIPGMSVVSTKTYAIPPGISMQVILKSYELGEKSLLFISTENAEEFQRMTQTDLENYSGKSAYFRSGKLIISVLKVGDESPAVEVEKLRILNNHRVEVLTLKNPESLDDMRIMMAMDDIKARGLSADPETLCGADDRSRSSDSRVGRLMPVGCTGWLIQNDLALSAGHCVGSMDIIEFQVPDSTGSGATQPASVNDQYPIIKSTMESEDGGIGNDWVVFKIGPNSNTGKLPGVAQGGHFKLSQSARPMKAIVTGYGVDNEPVGTSDGRNSDNQTQQTENGMGDAKAKFFDNNGSSFFRYRIDTRGGNSGSPVIIEGNPDTAIAIHTHGGCAAGSDGNHGTSASNADLRSAIKKFVKDLSKVYID